MDISVFDEKKKYIWVQIGKVSEKLREIEERQNQELISIKKLIGSEKSSRRAEIYAKYSFENDIISGIWRMLFEKLDDIDRLIERQNRIELEQEQGQQYIEAWESLVSESQEDLSQEEILERIKESNPAIYSLMKAEILHRTNPEEFERIVLEMGLKLEDVVDDVQLHVESGKAIEEPDPNPEEKK